MFVQGVQRRKNSINSRKSIWQRQKQSATNEKDYKRHYGLPSLVDSKNEDMKLRLAKDVFPESIKQWKHLLSWLAFPGIRSFSTFKSKRRRNSQHLTPISANLINFDIWKHNEMLIIRGKEKDRPKKIQNVRFINLNSSTESSISDFHL